MAQLQPIRLDENTLIYLEATDDVYADADIAETTTPESTDFNSYYPNQPRHAEILVSKSAGLEKAIDRMKALEDTIRGYTHYTLNAFRNLAVANVDSVKLEFGVAVSGEAGIPYITKGEVDSNLKITVECSFPPVK